MNRDRLQDIYRNTHLADKSDIDSIRQMTLDYPYYNLPYVILSKYYHDTQHYKFEDMLRQAAMRVKDRQALYDYIHGRNETTQHVPVEKAIEIIEDDVPQILEQVETSVEAFLNEQVEETAIENPLEEILEQPLELSPVQEVYEESQSVKEFLEISHETETAQKETVKESETGNAEGSIEESSSDHIVEPVMIDQKPVEFILDTTHEQPALDKIEIDHDIIGEEIETEFSFSRSFSHTDNTGENDLESTHKEPEILHNIDVFEDDVTESVNQEENHFRDISTGKSMGEIHPPVPEMDFFAWLKAPKIDTTSLETEQKEEIITEQVKEEKTEPEKNQPEEHQTEEEKENEESKFKSNLDLIDRFIQTNPQITRPKKEFFNPENMAKKSEVIDLEFVSETLANIYYEQGNYELAIKAYEKLSLQNPSKQAYFADLIEKIRKERK